MVSESDEVKEAVAASKLFADRISRVGHWTDYLGAAWEGVRRANSRGVEKRWLREAGKNGIRGWLRSGAGDPARDKAKRRGRGQVFLSANDPVDDDGTEVGDMLPAPESGPTPLEIWAEEKWQRAEAPIRGRVYLYLMCVEGWTISEVAEALGISYRGVTWYTDPARWAIKETRENATC